MKIHNLVYKLNYFLNPLDDFNKIVVTCWAGTARIAG